MDTDLSTPAALQPHIQTIKGLTNETALINAIKNILSSPDVFVFGELLDLDSIRSLSTKEGQGKQHYDLLKIFAHGKYSDYKAKANELPQLTDKQVRKLKQLSIVSLAENNQAIPYSKLLSELDIDNLRELGDLIIDALYRNIIIGKLDHEKQEFQVEAAIGRDLKPQDLDKMINFLERWEKQSDLLMSEIDKKINLAQEHNKQVSIHKVEFEKKLEEMKNMVKVAMEADGGGNAYFGDAVNPLMGGDQKMGRRDKQKGKPGRGRQMV